MHCILLTAFGYRSGTSEPKEHVLNSLRGSPSMVYIYMGQKYQRIDKKKRERKVHLNQLK